MKFNTPYLMSLKLVQYEVVDDVPPFLPAFRLRSVCLKVTTDLSILVSSLDL